MWIRHLIYFWFGSYRARKSSICTFFELRNFVVLYAIGILAIGDVMFNSHGNATIGRRLSATRMHVHEVCWVTSASSSLRRSRHVSSRQPSDARMPARLVLVCTSIFFARTRQANFWPLVPIDLQIGSKVVQNYGSRYQSNWVDQCCMVQCVDLYCRVNWVDLCCRV